ncbi:PfkB family carbohydrate kinase [Amphibiibacter pelophylacis]|uniref:PfkB family carbohydrate kinase n=1 Tax=Amphibiibacter pelophylacis TaxID=1799477 RepID=A0ACC6P0J6_9BURK
MTGTDTPCAVVVGGANVDVLARTHTAGLAGDSLPGDIGVSAGGVARNIADNLARLLQAPGGPQGQVHLLSAWGSDPLGLWLRSSTEACGVDTTGGWAPKGARSAAYLALHDATGELAGAVNDMAVLAGWPAMHLADALRPRLSGSAALVLDGNLSPEQIDAALNSTGPLPPLFVDPVSAHKAARWRPWLSRIHTLKPDRLEAAVLLGLDPALTHDAQRLIDGLHDAGVARVFLSGGPQGLLWSVRDPGQPAQSGLQPSLVRGVVNTSGAGDALMAALVYGHLLLDDWTWPERVRWASACSALTVESPHTVAPDLTPAAVAALLDEINAPT